MREVMQALAWPELTATLTSAATVAKMALGIAAMFALMRAAAWLIVSM